MSRMSPEEEEAVQAELEALQREAMVSRSLVSILCPSMRRIRINIRGDTDEAARGPGYSEGRAGRSSRCAQYRAGGACRSSQW
jgi:hypothetical protein